MTSYTPYAHTARYTWWPALLLVGIFFVLPLVTLTLEGLVPADLTRVFTAATTTRVWWFTTWQALVSTMSTMVIALPATWLVSRNVFRGRRALVALLTLPFLLPTVVVGVAFLALLPPSLRYTATAVILAHVYFNIAVFVRVVGPAWSAVPHSLLHTAQLLGASPLVAFHTVTLPLIRRALVSALGLTFLFCFTSYGVVRILGGPRLSTVETEIYFRAVSLGDTSVAIALGIVQMVALALVAWLLVKLGGPRTSPMVADWATTSRRTRPVLVAATSITYAILVSVPLAFVFSRSFIVRNTMSWSGWRQVLAGDFGAMVLQSLEYAVVASAITLAVGYGVAHSIVHRRMHILESASAATLTVSSVTLGLAIIVTFDNPPLDLRSWWLITPVAHALVALPIVVRTITPVVAAVPLGLAHAAATLGASPLRSWLNVQWPLVRGGALAALAMSFAVSVGEFGATSFLTRRESETMPVAIARLLGRPGDANQLGAYAMASILIIVCAVAVAMMERSRVEASR